MRLGTRAGRAAGGLAATAALIGSVAVAMPAQAAPDTGERDVYTATLDAEKADELTAEGLDVIETEDAGKKVKVDMVLTEAEADRLSDRGLKLGKKRNKRGETVAEMAAAQADNGFTVWRSWDEPGGIRDEMYAVAKDNPEVAKLVTLGKTHQGREILAIKVTDKATKTADGKRDAVLYSSTQHAREWISTEVNRRTMHHFINGYNSGDAEITSTLKKTELWFVLVANPDGYQYTFDHDRLWRKNLRDNNGNGEVDNGDGVDPNRNFDEHFNYDREGSSSLPSSGTYRGPSPASEPTSQALAGLMAKTKPVFQSNWHSFGEWILYPQGWQIGTPDADNPLYVAMSGTDANPAIEGFDPGQSADELYVTNGETTDYASIAAGTIAFTPELGEGEPGAGFVFPDDEALVQAEFEKTLPFSMGLALSANDPENPQSPIGMDLESFYLSQADVDAENGAISMFDFRFDESYGDPQEVRVLAKRSLGKVTLNYRINGGKRQKASTGEWTGGEKYGIGNGKYYKVASGTVTGTDPGDEVEVWFTARGERSESFTYTAVSESGADTLVLAAEDYTGASPSLPAGPQYLEYYTDALDANNVSYDVYDVDAKGRVAADHLGVLSHYDAVVWYTGDDVVTRKAGWEPGGIDRVAVTSLFEVRDYLNEGGRVMYTGQNAGQQYTTNFGAQRYDPFENAECYSDEEILQRCRAPYGSGNGQGDIIEYWFGAALSNSGAGTDPDGAPYGLTGEGNPFEDLSPSISGGDGADNQSSPSSFVSTSGLLPADEYPQFESWVSQGYDRPGGPFDPHSGEHYVYSQIGDVTYKRLTRTISVPADGADLSFWTSYNTEADWDFTFVEARTAGGDDWTTLPDANGHTSQETGSSCTSGWNSLHPQMDHYQTINEDGTCSPTGTTGEWHAASGSSGAWEQWSVDLSAYAGQEVEISVAYVSDWGTQGLGVFLDDIAVSTGDGSTDFEADLGGWEISGSPEGSAPNGNDFERISGTGFPEGAAVATEDTLYLGYGFEAINSSADRTEVMGRAMRYLLR